MVSRAIGEDQLSPGQPLDFAGQDRIGFEAGAIDVVDEFEKALGLIQMLLDQPAQGRAVTRIIMLVQRLRRQAVETEKLDQEQGDALVDTRPDAAVGRVEGVVEIEDPGRHMAEAGPQRLIRGQPELGRLDQGRHDAGPDTYAKLFPHRARAGRHGAGRAVLAKKLRV